MSRISGRTSESASKLLELAKERFGELNKAEETLFRSFADGELADYSAEKEKDNDPAKADKWGRERILDADRITWLCTNSKTSELATHNGVQVKGARIDGVLDLSFAKISFPLNFKKSAFPARVYLQHAEIQALFLIGTHTGPISAVGLKVEGYVLLRSDFRADGEVNLLGATIGGSLECDGHFINKGAIALTANSATIKGTVFLRKGFKAEGEVNLIGATIGADLDCEGAQFINKGAIALTANSANIKGYVFLYEGFKAEGEVDLLGATIGQSLECDRGQFINKSAHALRADSMTVKRHVFMRDGFKAEGVVDLIGATIAGYFEWRDVNSPKGVMLNLSSVSVGVLWDEKESWPEKGRLLLPGLVYNEIYEKAPRDAKSRVEWLRRQPGFRPQPYEQLAAVLGKSGQDEDAKKILIAKNHDRARLTKLTTRSDKIWYRVLGPMIGYGYRPLNALWGVLVFVVLGWILFGLGYCGGLITPHSESAYVERSVKTVDCATKSRELSDVYPRFNFLVYSLDTFVPLIDLHQSKYWLPNANLGPGLLNIKGMVLHAGGLLRLYLWIHIVMGWALTTLLVVGLTGLIRT